jgi:hypothetical protein
VFSCLRTVCFKKLVAKRIVLAVMLTLALFSGVAPLDALSSSGQMCTMSCCAGQPPHPAHSGAGGACHVNLLVHKRAPKSEPEAHCGGVEAARTHHGGMTMQEPRAGSDSSSLHAHGEANHFPAQRQPSRSPSSAPSVATIALTKPCKSDCGTGTASSTNRNNSRERAVVSYACKPRPPTDSVLLRVSDNPATTLSVLCRESRPRAPPLSFS